MGSRKYWIGSSDQDDHKPTDFDTFVVEDEEEMQDIQARVAEWMAQDYLDNEGVEDE